MGASPQLKTEALLKALRQGDYYASTGVTLSDFSFTQNRFRMSVQADPRVKYITKFVGTRPAANKSWQVGAGLAQSTGAEAEYRLHGDSSSCGRW